MRWPATEMVQTARLYGRLLRRGPREFVDRLRVFAEIRADKRHAPSAVYQPYRWEDALPELERQFDGAIARYSTDAALAELEAALHHIVSRLHATAPFMNHLNADIALARSCYLLCRAVKPRVVVETGVGYGVISSFILQALEVNGQGCLHSIDLPPIWPGAERLVGVLVPERLRPRWRLHKGPSRRLLPAVLAQAGQVDLFIHDSLHTYHNMRWELATVTPSLARPAVVIVDDANENAAFAEWTATSEPSCWLAVQQVEKRNLFGIATFADAEHGVPASSQGHDTLRAAALPESVALAE
ncbi:MAG TPA: class I SAM-dependent methyltransferase [Herpetosiphonaceae bacterium]|nr:class I SAM-dependent methyltransferase [Herpetosiphonaceae bacterium]